MSDGVLAGLDEQQLEAVTTLRGPGRRARRRRHRQDARHHAPHRPRRRHRRLLARDASWRSPSPRRPRARCAGDCGRSASRASRRGPSTPPRSRSSTTSGRRSPATRCPASSTTRCACSRTPPTAWASSRTPRRCATSRAASSGARSRCAASRSTPRRGRTGSAGSRSERVADLQRAYEKLKDERRQLDFEDVLLACAGMLEAEPHVARAVHEQYRHFTVDEFQDVSPLQHRLLELWLGDRRDICVVGDASQTIYSFAGADARFLLEFESRHEGARVVRLETNHRSDAAILAVANELMRDRPGALAPRRGARAPEPMPQREPTADGHRLRGRRGRGARRRRADRAADRRGHRPAPDRRPLPRARPVGRARRRRSPTRASPPRCSAAGASSTSPRCARRSWRCAAHPSRPSRAGSSTPCATCCARSGSPTSRRRPAVRCAMRGRRARRILRLAEEAPEGTTLRGVHRRADRRARKSQRRAGAAHRHPRDAARRQGPGVGPRPPRRGRRGPAADLLRDDVRAGRRGAAPGVRRHHAGWANAVAVVVAGTRGTRQPSRFLREIGSGTLRAVGAPATSGAASRRAASASGRRPRCGWRSASLSMCAVAIRRLARSARRPTAGDAGRAAARRRAATPGRRRGGARRRRRGTRCARAARRGRPRRRPGEHDRKVRDVARHERRGAPRVHEVVREHDDGRRALEAARSAHRTR